MRAGGNCSIQDKKGKLKTERKCQDLSCIKRPL